MKNYVTAAVGAILLAAGLVLLKTLVEPAGIMLALPYILIGLGCGVFGHGMGDIVSMRIAKRHPEAYKQMEIEKNDERNLAIANKAKAKAFDMMTFVFGVLMVCLALMGTDVAVVLLLVFAYLLVHGFCIYYRLKYEREM